ncbi:DUF4267 domain-containing protein, partial [Escherichia coli]
GQRQALGAALLAFAFIPACDAAIVLLNGGAPAIAFGIHATTACLLRQPADQWGWTQAWIDSTLAVLGPRPGPGPGGRAAPKLR